MYIYTHTHTHTYIYIYIYIYIYKCRHLSTALSRYRLEAESQLRSWRPLGAVEHDEQPLLLHLFGHAALWEARDSDREV